MRFSRSSVCTIIAVTLAIPPLTAAAQEDKMKPATRQSRPKTAPSENASAQRGAEAIRTMHAYQASLEKLLKIYAEEFEKKVVRVPERRELYEKGYISRLELEESQQELAGVEAKLRETEQKIAETKIGIAEAASLEQIRRLPPLALGEYRDKGATIRYNGKTRWSLGVASQIHKVFSERFGRPLPVSALGQTPFHEQMKLDHREAMDVALHPDSLEGRWLMIHLRGAGISFIAFRNGVPGAASGAHIHIGPPSARAASR